MLSFSKQKTTKNIESKVAAEFFGLCVGAGILFGVNSMTGAAIGFASAPSGFLGAVLFVGGTEIIPRPQDIGFKSTGFSFYRKV